MYQQTLLVGTVLKMGVGGGDVRQRKGRDTFGISAIEKLYLTNVLLAFYCGVWAEEDLESSLLSKVLPLPLQQKIQTCTLTYRVI